MLSIVEVQKIFDNSIKLLHFWSTSSSLCLDFLPKDGAVQK